MSEIDGSLVKLRADLLFAKTISQSGARASRVAAILVLNAFADFIEGVDNLKSQDLGITPTRLAAALADLENGTVSEILKPIHRSGRPKDPANWEVVKGLAAAAMETLMARSGREAAAKSVAAELKRERFKLDGDKPLTWRTVANWRDQIRSSEKDADARATYLRVIELERELKKSRGFETDEQFSKNVLHTLTAVLKNFRD